MPQDHQGSQASGSYRNPRPRQDLSDYQMTGVPRSSCPITVFFWILVCGFATAYILWPSKPEPKTHGPAITLTNSEAASFHELFQKIATLDTEIKQLDTELFNMDVAGLSDPKIVEQYYRKLSNLEEMKIDRARYAQNYNGLARNHFTRSASSPVEMRLRKDFLPTGIR